MPKARRRLKYHNRTKVLLCYLLAWGLALVLPYLLLRYVYPYKLAGSAPDLAITLAGLPLPEAARSLLAASAVTPGMAQGPLQAALDARDLLWRYAVGAVLALTWALSLLWQLLWRASYLRPADGARAAQRAIRGYRLSMLGIATLGALGALGVFWLGLRWVAGRTVWDYLVYFCGFALTPLAAMVCFRLGAPPAISGRKAFFKRL